MISCAFALRLPAEEPSFAILPAPVLNDNTPAVSSSVSTSASTQLEKFNVDAAVAIKTPQFWLMYSGSALCAYCSSCCVELLLLLFRFGLSITGAYGLLSTGKTMFADVVTPAFPALAAVASTFVITMSLSNLGGRFFYSTLSDYFVKWTGRDPFYGLFFFFFLKQQV